MFRPGRTLTPFDNYGRCSWNRKKTRSYTDFFDPYFSIRIIYSVPLYDDRHLLPDNLIDSLWIINIICFLDNPSQIYWMKNEQRNERFKISINGKFLIHSLIAKISCLKIFHRNGRWLQNRKKLSDSYLKGKLQWIENWFIFSSTLNINFKIFIHSLLNNTKDPLTTDWIEDFLQRH